MEIAFYVSGLVAIASTFMVITQTNGVHALLYLIVSLLSVAIVFFTLGAPFAAALEVIVYAGAIMVLFVFVVMMLNLGQQTVEQEKAWLTPGTWVGPAILCAVLAIEIAFVLMQSSATFSTNSADVPPMQVGIALFGPYVLGVELASMLLLAGLVGAYHLGRREEEQARYPGEVPQMLSGDDQKSDRDLRAAEASPTASPRVKERV